MEVEVMARDYLVLEVAEVKSLGMLVEGDWAWDDLEGMLAVEWVKVKKGLVEVEVMAPEVLGLGVKQMTLQY